MPNIDVIIPTFNKAAHLERCINSCLNQKEQFNKIIIINDGSTDNTTEVFKKFKNDKIIIISQKNQGVSNARNKGIKYSNSEFVVFLDSDDELNEFYLYEIKRMLKKFRHRNPSILSAKHLNIFDNTKLKKEYFNSSNQLKEIKYPLFAFSINKKILCSSGICVKRELIQKNLFPENIKLGEDIYVWEKILLKKNLFLSNQNLIYVYKNSENRSQEIHKLLPPYYLIKYRDIVKNKFNFIQYFSLFLFHFSSLVTEVKKFKNEKKNLQIFQAQTFFFKFIIYIINFYFFDKFINLIFFLKDKLNKFNLINILIYSLTTPSVPLIFIIFYFKSQFESSITYTVSAAFILIFTTTLTFHSRAYVFNNFSRSYLDSLIIFRLINSLILSFILNSIGFFLLDKNYIFLLAVNSLLFLWNIDLYNLKLEKLYAKSSIYKIFFLILFFYFLIIYFKNSIEYYLVSLAFLLISIILILKSIKKPLLSLSMGRTKKLFLKGGRYFLYSSIIFVISNFIVRYLISNNIETKEFVAGFFLILSICTFPGTLYGNTLAQYENANEKWIKNIYNLVFFFIVTFVIILLFIFKENSYLSILTLLTSIIGLILNLLSNQLRFRMINENKIKYLNYFELIFSILIISYVYCLVFNSYLINFYIIFNGLTLLVLMKVFSKLYHARN